MSRVNAAARAWNERRCILPQNYSGFAITTAQLMSWTEPETHGWYLRYCLEIASTATASVRVRVRAGANDVDDAVNVIDNQFRIVAMKPKAEKPSDWSSQPARQRDSQLASQASGAAATDVATVTAIATAKPNEPCHAMPCHAYVKLLR